MRTSRMLCFSIYRTRLLAIISFVLTLLLIPACSEKNEASTTELIITDAMAKENNTGVGLMGQFDYENALTVFEHLNQQYPSWINVKVNRSIAILNRNLEGDSDLALELLNQILRDSNNNLRAHYLKGILLQHQGKIEEAITEFKTVLGQKSEEAYAAYFLAQGLVQTNQYQSALTWYQKAVQVDPYLRSAYYGAFKAAQKLKEVDLARSYLKTFQALNNNPRAKLAEIKYTRMGPLAEAKTENATNRPSRNLPSGPLFSPVEIYDLSTNHEIPIALNNKTEIVTTLATADINNNHIQDLWVTFKDKNYLFIDKDFTPTSPMEGPTPLAANKVNATLWGDYDNDGMTDLLLLRDGANQLWKNYGNGDFREVQLVGANQDNANSVDGAIFDADHDGDLDFFIVNRTSQSELVNNNLDGSFRNITKSLPLGERLGQSKHILTFDFDQDRDTDLLLINATPPHVALANDRLWQYQAATGFETFEQADISTAVVADMDADGKMEIYTIDSNGKFYGWRTRDGQWSPESLNFNVVPQHSRYPQLAISDITGDGKLEMIVSDGNAWSVYAFNSISRQYTRIFHAISDNQIVNWLPVIYSPENGPSVVALSESGQLLVWSPGSGRFAFTTLAFSGLEKQADSMRSNASGIGTQVGVRRGSQWTISNTFRHYSGPGQSLQPLSIGLGNEDAIDFIAINWSDGVFQTELNLSAGFHSVTETQRQLASCPVLFAWDGDKFQFISDIIGVGGLGFAVGPNEYATPRPWENFLLPEKILKPQDNFYQIIISEPMEEVMYFDHAELVAYDIPADTEILLDERMGVNEPYPTGDAYLYKERIFPHSATNEMDEDVLPTLLAVDKHAAPVKHVNSHFVGLTEPQQLTLEFENPIDAQREPFLLVNGWIEYPYSQTSFAAWQAGKSYQAPSLDFRAEDGEWHTLYRQFGYPAGMPRQMALPLRALPANTREIRLTTNMEIYWDSIAIVYANRLNIDELNRRGITQRLISLDHAEALETGFAKRSTAEQRYPHYDFNQRSPLWDTRHPSGYYTNFGDVTELVQDKDDAVAIIGPGEALKLSFPEIDDPIPAKQKRVFVLRAKGWVKDMDLYTQDGETVTPLPGKTSQIRDKLHQKYNQRYH